MAKHDWKSLQAEFLLANTQTGVKAKEWCESKGLNYSSARRYIKSSSAKPEDVKRAKSSPKSKEIAAKNKPSTTKDPRKQRFGNKNRLVHGGYSKYFQGDVGELVEATTLSDELDLCRSRIHLVIKAIEDIQKQLDANPPIELATSLFESLFKADNALDRNIARVESIEKTMSAIELDKLNQHKIVADTDRSIKIAKATVVKSKKDAIQTELVELQVVQARKEAGGTSKLDDFIDQLTGGGVDKVVG